MEEEVKSLLFQKEENKAAICRVCLNCESHPSEKGLSLFEKYNDYFVFEKINYIASIEIKKGDDFPDRICSTCLLALDNACIFKQRCESSDAILHSTLQLEEPLEKQFIEVPLKEENEDEFEYDCLYESPLSPSQLELTVEVETKYADTQSREATFKSKAIDLQLECHDCGETFKSKCKLRVHWKKVHQPKQLTCPHCKKILGTYKSFHSHIKKRSKSCMNASKMRVEGEGRSRVYYCKECDAHSKRIQTIMTHLVTHTGERPYTCNICGKSFTQHSSLACHKEGAHKKYCKEGTCHQCGKYFKGRTKLYRHMKTHSNEQFPCKVCFKMLRSKPILRQHMRRHSGIKAFTCEVCAKTFYTSSDLWNHKNKTHDKNRIYTCDLCNYKTVNSSCMAKHRPRHTDDNIACDVCGRFVDNQNQLVMHKKRHFEKNYQCTYCNRMYYGRKNLTAHVRKKHKMYAASNRGINSYSVKVEVQKVPQSV